MTSKKLIFSLIMAATAIAQEQPSQQGLRSPQEPSPSALDIVAGTKIPLSLLNTLSSKQTAHGDRVYLETLYPVILNGRIVVPQGSYVSGTVTEVKRAGRIKGRAELYLRFDSLTLPNGVTREFRARIGGMEGGGNNELDREEGKVKGGGGKGDDARTVGQAAQVGTMVGGIAGAVGGRPVAGVLGGASAGAAAGLASVLLTRGPDVVLPKGSVVEMLLDWTVSYDENDLDFSRLPPRSTRNIVAPAADESRTQRRGIWPLPF
jgi:hypothetical protein